MHFLACLCSCLVVLWLCGIWLLLPDFVFCSHFFFSGVYQPQKQRCCTCRRWKKWKAMARKVIKPRYVYKVQPAITSNTKEVCWNSYAVYRCIIATTAQPDQRTLLVKKTILPQRLLCMPLLSSNQDSTGTDVTLGSCLDGIFVKHKNGRPVLLFR